MRNVLVQALLVSVKKKDRIKFLESILEEQIALNRQLMVRIEVLVAKASQP